MRKGRPLPRKGTNTVSSLLEVDADGTVRRLDFTCGVARVRRSAATTRLRLAEAASRAASARLYESRLVVMAQQMLERSTTGQKPLSDALKRELEAVM